MTKNKLTILSLIALLLSTTFFIACSKENEETVSENISTLKLTDQTQINKIVALIGKSNNSTLSRIKEIYNFDDIKIVGLNGQKERAILVNSVDFNDENIENKSIMLAYNDNVVNDTPIVIRTIKSNENLNIIKYETIDNVNLMTINIDKAKQTIQIVNKSKIANKLMYKSCGQDVVDCVADVYTNHGWTSVAVGLVSAFIPQTVVAYTAACAAKNCNG